MIYILSMTILDHKYYFFLCPLSFFALPKMDVVFCNAVCCVFPGVCWIMQRCILQQKWWSINALSHWNGIIAGLKKKKKKIDLKKKKKKKIVRMDYCHTAKHSHTLTVLSDTQHMTTIRLTPARKRFLKQFNDYTDNGANPHALDNAWQQFRTQPRVINYCRRNGLIKQAGLHNAYVVTLEAKRMANIVDRMVNTLIVRRRTRKRSSALQSV